jgi:hypothetical protein
MENILYVSNLAETVTEDQLHALFGQYGDIKGVEIGVDEAHGGRYALITMGSEKTANKANHGLNGTVLEERYLYVSSPEVDLTRELMGKQRKMLEEIVAALNETEKVPLRKLDMMARQCGTSFMQALLKEAQEVEATGGMMTKDGTRRRSLGGVFFQLALRHMSPPVRHLVHVRKGKPRVATEEDGETQQGDEGLQSSSVG